MPVGVQNLEVDFPNREQGLLRFSLRLPANTTPPRSVSWDLRLDGFRFATGIETQVTINDAGEVMIHTPLSAHSLGWQEGDAVMDVELRGEVDVGRAGDALQFREKRAVGVHGKPELRSPLE